MKRRNKALAVSLCAAMAASMFTGCSEKTTSTEAAKTTEAAKATEAPKAAETAAAQANDTAETGITYPLDTDVQLRIYILSGLALPSGYSEWDEVPFLKGLEERWGVDIIWESAPAGADKDVAYNLMLQDADLPQIVFGNKCTTNNMEGLVNDGIAMDLSGLLETYAPDYWAYLHNPDDINRVKDLALATTEKYGLTHFIGPRHTPENGTWAGTAIRKDWLDALGLEVPSTLEEADVVARAFHENYGAVVTGVKSWFANCHFMSDGTDSMATWQWSTYLEDGEVKCANIGDEYREYLEFMHTWYEDGILDQNFSGATTDSLLQMVNAGETGFICTAADYLATHNSDAETYGTGAEWIPIPNIVKNEGDMARAAHANYSAWVGKAGSFITTNCTEEQLKAALAILNYGYTEEGMIYWNFGEEGVSFEYDAEGNPKFTDLVLNHELGILEARKTYTGAATNTMASAQMWEAVATDPQMIEATEIFCSNNVAAEYKVPALTYSDEVKGTYNDLLNAIQSYVNEMALKFVTGEESLDKYDEYVATVESMGLEELMKLMNDAYDSFAERGGLK